MNLRALLVALLPVLACCATTPEAEEEMEATEDALTNAIANGTSMTTTSRLNLRAEPDTAADVLVTMPKGASVKTIAAASSNGFFNVSYDGKEGWAHSQYLKSGGAPEPEAGTGTFNGKTFSNVSMRWEGDYDFLAKCDPPWGAQFSCNSKPSKSFVDNGLWIAVPHTYWSTKLCNKSARVCKGDSCLVATIMDRGSTSYFEGSTPVLAKLGVAAGAKGCASYGTTTGVTVTFE